ncbi:hypothetical protein D3C85_1417380 [compost metagenome]
MAVAFGRPQSATEVALAFVVKPAGVGVGVDEQAALQTVRGVAGAGGEKGPVSVHLTTGPADIAITVAEAGMGAELFGEALRQADHQPLAMLVAAGGLGRTIGAQITRQRRAP